MKFFGYVLRNALRNPIRSILTIGSIAVSLLLMMILLSFLAMNSQTAQTLGQYNRLVTLSSQGFTVPVPIGMVNDVKGIDGVVAVSPLSWYGGKYKEESNAFAQFGVDPAQIFAIYDEFSVPPDQLKAFQDDRAGCIIGRKLADDRKIKVGDALPLKGTIYPFDMNLTVRGIYDGPSNRDLRACWFHWDYLEEGLKRDFQGRGAGNAGALVIKVKDAPAQARVSAAIDKAALNSNTPTRTQTEEAFVGIFLEMWGDIRGMIRNVGLAVVFSLICVAGNAMAMALRERTTEVAVLKAIGFSRPLVVSLVLAEAILVAAIGGLVGALGSKAFFDYVDITPYTGGQLPFFYVPWTTALLGMGVAILIGLLSGLVPAIRAAQLPVVDGLRKVI
jgi:putative ABC transport system permease protein